MFAKALTAEKECKPFISYHGANYGTNYRRFQVPDDYTSVYCLVGANSSFNSTFYLNGSQLNGITKIDSVKFCNTDFWVHIYKLPINLSKGNFIAVSAPMSAQYIQFYGTSVGNGDVTLNLSGDAFKGITG